MNHKLRQLAKRVLVGGAALIGLKQPESKIAADSQRYWENSTEGGFRSNSHWSGEGGLSEDVFLKLGKIHLDMFNEFSPLTTLTRPLERIVEWGSGGGSNAVHFAKLAREFIGVDVSQASLDECWKSVRAAGSENFLPVLIEVANPEGAIERIPGACDLFLCIYVFELLPTPEYGRRILEIAHRVLRPGGIALIQIRYATSESRTKSRRWGYRLNLVNMTTYTIDGFWELAQAVGFKPRAVILHQKQPLVHEERYAYFFLERP
jgi:SAM-dependent methyltransferase